MSEASGPTYRRRAAERFAGDVVVGPAPQAPRAGMA
jgi:hypothetical protein